MTAVLRCLERVLSVLISTKFRGHSAQKSYITELRKSEIENRTRDKQQK